MNDLFAFSVHTPQKVGLQIVAASFLVVLFLILNLKRKPAPPPGTVRPPHVKSFLPYIGSAIQMGSVGPTEFIRMHSKRFNDAPIFTAILMGETYVFVADPEYLNAVFKAKYSQYLDSSSLQKQFTKTALSCSDKENEMIFSDSAIKVAQSQYLHYLFKGKELESSIGKVQDYFNEHVIPSMITASEGDGSPHSGWTECSLFEMTTSAIFKASVGPFIGDSVANDEMLQHFRDFDEGIMRLFNGYPQIFTKQAQYARSQLFNKLGSNDFWATASKLLQDRRKELVDKLGVAEDAFKKANLGVMWASTGNSAPAVFWTLIHLLDNADAWNACQKQVFELALKRKSGKTDVYSLDDIEEFTYLDSAFWEALRLYASSFTARKVAKDFALDVNKQNYWIEHDSRIMSWWGMLHFDSGVFEKPTKFQFDRFVGKNKNDFTFKNGKVLPHNPVTAFGGGNHYCPGRKFIFYEARLFLAMLIENFEMRLVKGECIPPIDKSRVGIGVSQPLKDVKIEFRLRQA